MGFAVSFALFVTGAVLVVGSDTPKSGPNLQTAGLILMLVALTALHVAMALRPEPRRRFTAGPRR